MKFFFSSHKKKRYFYLFENITQDNDTISSVASQGQYEISTVDEERVSRVGPDYAPLLHNGKCTPNDDECDRLVPPTDQGVELAVEWGECVEGVTQLGVRSEPDDRASTYELVWPEDGPHALWRQSVRTCSTLNVTLPRDTAHALVDHVVPELWVTQHHPETPHAVDADPTTHNLCQHSSFGHLVLMPPPDIVDLVPPAVCRQDVAAKLRITGRYIVQATAEGNDTQQVKPRALVTHNVPASGGVDVTQDNYTVTEDFELTPDNVALSACALVAVDRYASVEHCTTSELVVSGNDHYSVDTVQPGNEQDPTKLAPLSAVSLRNPPPIDCISSDPVEFRTIEQVILFLL